MNENGTIQPSLVFAESIQWNAVICSNNRASVTPKYLMHLFQITNSTSRIAVIIGIPFSKSTFCLNLTNTIFQVLIRPSQYLCLRLHLHRHYNRGPRVGCEHVPPAHCRSRPCQNPA
jgi:hypothetical protein